MSIINCEPNFKSISTALEQLYDTSFQEKLKMVINPYGEGGASEKVVAILKKHNLSGIVKKSFYNLKT